MNWNKLNPHVQAGLVAVAVSLTIWGGYLGFAHFTAAPELAAPTLPETVKAEVGDLVLLKADTAGAAVEWYSVSAGLSIIPHDAKSAVVSAKKPGKHKVLCWTAIHGKPSPAGCTIIDVSGTAPDPNPGPTPPGPAPPTPVTGKTWWVTVTDTSAETPDVAKMKVSPTWKKTVEAGGGRHVHLSKTDKAVSDKNLTPFIQEAGGTPCLIVLDQSGKKLRAVALPLNEAALQAVVKEVMGR